MAKASLGHVEIVPTPASLTQYILPATSGGKTTNMSTAVITITAASGGTPIIVTDVNRQATIVQNLLSGDVYLSQSGLQSGMGIKVGVNGTWESEMYIGSMWGIAQVSGNQVCVMEEYF